MKRNFFGDSSHIVLFNLMIDIVRKALDACTFFSFLLFSHFVYTSFLKKSIESPEFFFNDFKWVNSHHNTINLQPKFSFI